MRLLLGAILLAQLSSLSCTEEFDSLPLVASCRAFCKKKIDTVRDSIERKDERFSLCWDICDVLYSGNRAWLSICNRSNITGLRDACQFSGYRPKNIPSPPQDSRYDCQLIDERIILTWDVDDVLTVLYVKTSDEWREFLQTSHRQIMIHRRRFPLSDLHLRLVSYGVDGIVASLEGSFAKLCLRNVTDLNRANRQTIARPMIGAVSHDLKVPGRLRVKLSWRRQPSASKCEVNWELGPNALSYRGRLSTGKAEATLLLATDEQYEVRVKCFKGNSEDFAVSPILQIDTSRLGVGDHPRHCKSDLRCGDIMRVSASVMIVGMSIGIIFVGIKCAQRSPVTRRIIQSVRERRASRYAKSMNR